MTSFTLFGQGATGSGLIVDPVPYTMGVQFSVAQAAALTAIWFYSPPGAAVLPQVIALHAVSGASLVTSEAASWSGAAGSGWVRAAFASPPPLTPAVQYKAAILQGTTASWYSTTPHYWDAGPGSGGVSSGPLSAPGNSGADAGQDSFHQSAALAYPDGSFNASNYWVDPEISAGAVDVSLADSGPGADSLTLAGAASLAGAGTGDDSGTVAAAVSAANPGTASDAAAVTAAVPLADPGAGDGTLSPAAALGLADPGGGTDGLAVPGSGSPVLGDAGEAGDGIAGLRQSAAFPDVELMLIGWLQSQFPAARWCTELPADITETTVHVTRIAGANRSLRVDRPIVDVDVFALDHATSVAVALGIQALLKVARNVVSPYGVLQSASTVNGPRWLPEINPALRRRSATYELRVHA